jgi:MerR family transcriptional regulator, redox-sensitive transcriptional activator SoxR
VIKAAQRMGISLQEIKTAFASLPNNRTPDKDDWARLSRHWQGDLDSRIRYLQKLRDYLNGCIGCGCLSMKKCPLYNPDDVLASEGSGPVLLEREELQTDITDS